MSAVKSGLRSQVTGLLDALIIAAGSALTLLMLAQVVMRYLLDGGFLGVEELGVLFGVWFYFLGMARASTRGEHIRGGIAELVVHSARGRRCLALFEAMFVFAGNAVFCWFAFAYTYALFESGRTSTYMSWPSVLWAAAMAVGFALALLFSLARLRNVGRDETLT